MESHRKSHLPPVRMLVIKLGTQLLSSNDGQLDVAYLSTIAEQIAALRERNIRVTIVSSGAIGAGLRELNLHSRPTDQAKQLVRAEKSALGKGGMNSKLEAARMVTGAGEAMIVADGRMKNVLPRMLDGEAIGTLFIPARGKRSSRSRWIGSVRTNGTI